MPLINKTKLHQLADSQKDELTDIVDKRLEMPSSWDQDFAALVSKTDPFAKLAAIWQYTDKRFDGIEPKTVYCRKTGVALYAIEDKHFALLLQVQNKTQGETLEPSVLQSSVAPWWIRTDGKALDQLAELDPVGYFVYAASMVTYRRAKIDKADDPKGPSVTSDTEWLRQKIKLHAYLQHKPLTAIVKLNRLFHKLLQFEGKLLYVPWRALDELAVDQRFDDLEQTINVLITRVFNKYLGSARKPTAINMAEFANKHRAGGQFASQNAFARNLAAAEILRMFDDVGLDISDEHDTHVARSYTGMREAPHKKRWHSTQPVPHARKQPEPEAGKPSFMDMVRASQVDKS